jgi:hypothetical protein
LPVPHYGMFSAPIGVVRCPLPHMVSRRRSLMQHITQIPHEACHFRCQDSLKSGWQGAVCIDCHWPGPGLHRSSHVNMPASRLIFHDLCQDFAANTGLWQHQPMCYECFECSGQGIDWEKQADIKVWQDSKRIQNHSFHILPYTTDVCSH